MYVSVKATAHCTTLLLTPTNWGSAINHKVFFCRHFVDFTHTTLHNSDPELVGVGSKNCTVCCGL